MKVLGPEVFGGEFFLGDGLQSTFFHNFRTLPAYLFFRIDFVLFFSGLLSVSSKILSVLALRCSYYPLCRVQHLRRGTV